MRRVPGCGSRVERAVAGELRLAVAELGGVGPGMAVRACGATGCAECLVLEGDSRSRPGLCVLAACVAASSLDGERLVRVAGETGSQGWSPGHVTLRYGARSAEDHRDTKIYELPHQVGHIRPFCGWMLRPDA